MELIPILSTIILVATMMTFVLAIGAYILYKVREKQGQTYSYEHADQIQAEVLSPAEQESVYERVRSQSAFNVEPIYGSQGSSNYMPDVEQQQVRSGQVDQQGNQKFMKYTNEGYVAPKEDKKAGVLRWR